jgi:hypothetical protein
VIIIGLCIPFLSHLASFTQFRVTW